MSGSLTSSTPRRLFIGIDNVQLTPVSLFYIHHKNIDEAVSKAKFGGEEVYKRVKGVYERALKTWRGREAELGGRAFGMYEEFRPDVAAGRKGWGRKGSLSLGKVREVIARE